MGRSGKAAGVNPLTLSIIRPASRLVGSTASFVSTQRCDLVKVGKRAWNVYQASSLFHLVKRRGKKKRENFLKSRIWISLGGFLRHLVRASDPCRVACTLFFPFFSWDIRARRRSNDCSPSLHEIACGIDLLPVSPSGHRCELIDCDHTEVDFLLCAPAAMEPLHMRFEQMGFDVIQSWVGVPFAASRLVLV